MSKPSEIYVTKAFLPPRSEFDRYIDGIWKTNQLTNNGTLLQQLEANLRVHLGLRNLYMVTNGTLALQIAIRALDLTGEVITTPFSYVATTSALVWERCRPIMVDIDPATLTINPKAIRAAITPRTTAILATHVFGNPCEIDEIHSIGSQFNLKILYDAAHAFGVRVGNKSIFSWGDVSVASFHATKLFHTIEGGAIVAEDELIADRIYRMRNFGHVSAECFDGIGINGKASEFQAAMGLSVLPYVDEIISKRKCITSRYKRNLEGLPLKFQLVKPSVVYNYSYMPVVFETEDILKNVMSALSRKSIFPRRYFYPSLSALDYVEARHSTPISEIIAKTIICLPLYHDLCDEDVDRICEVIRQELQATR